MGLDMKEDAIFACSLTGITVEGYNVTFLEIILFGKVGPTLGQNICLIIVPESTMKVPN